MGYVPATYTCASNTIGQSTGLAQTGNIAGSLGSTQGKS